MKTFRLFFLVIFTFSLFTFTSCDLADITFDATLSENIDVVSESQTLKFTGYTFSGNAVIDPSSDPDVNEYWDMIKNWDIKKITISVKNIGEETNLTNGNLLLKDDDTNDQLYSVELESLLLQNGVKILEVTNEDWSKIVSALNAKHKIYAEISGTVDKPSVSITFKIEIDTEVTANPL